MLALHLILVRLLIFLQILASLVIRLIHCLLTIDVPSKTLVIFFLHLSLQGISVQIKFILAKSLSLNLLLSFLFLFEPFLLLHHFMIVDIVFPDFLI